MRLFHKLLILLLGIALVPLFFLSLFGFVETRSLGSVLASRVGSVEIDNARRELELWVETYAKMLRGKRSLFELVLQHQANAVERRLAQERKDLPKMSFSDGLDAGASASSDMARPPRHAPKEEDGKPPPGYVSFDHMDFRLAPLVKGQDVAEDMERLATMMPVYINCWNKHRDMLVWIYTALDNGIASGYPAAKGFPPDWDPRVRPWYVNARSAGTLVWSPPYVDALGMGLVSSLSMPVYRPDGSFAGVTGLDVRNMQKPHMPSPVYAENSNVQMFLCSLTPRGPAGEHTLQITSRKHYREENPRWTPLDTIAWLESMDLDQYRRMVEDIRAGKPGVAGMPFEGSDAFWAFNPLGVSGSTVVMIVPHGGILARADKLRELISQRAILAFGFAATGMAVAVVLVVVISYMGSRSIADPLQVLANATRQIATGRLDADLPSTDSRDEVAELTESVAAMRKALKIYIDDMTEAASARERVESELRIARGIQMSFLVKTFPPFPQKPEIDLYATIEPARAVGGDLYDFFLVDDTHLFFVIGDVSDKGVPAALLMAVTMCMMRSLAGRRMTPAEAFTVMNRELFQGSDSFMFITLFSGVLDTRTGDVLFANAGHNPPIVLPEAGEPSFLKVGKALVLAGSPRARYRTETLKLEPGDSLLLYTDGVTEAMNENRDLFSSIRLQEEVSGLRGAPPRETIGAVMDSVRSFRGDAPQSDDIAMLMIRYNGEGRG